MAKFRTKTPNVLHTVAIKHHKRQIRSKTDKMVFWYV